MTRGVKKNGSNTTKVATKTFFDDLGRTNKVIENDGGTGDEVRHTLYEYNGLNRITKLIVDTGKDNTLSGGAWTDPGADDDQTITYLYEYLYHAAWVSNAIYPDSSDTTSSGTNQVSLS